MNTSKLDLSVVYVRSDGSYVINKGTYHVPATDNYAELHQKITEYIASNPDCVGTEPEYIASSHTVEKYLQEKADKAIQAALNSWAIKEFTFSDENYSLFAQTGLIPSFDAEATYESGDLVVYENNVYRISLVDTYSKDSDQTIVLGNYVLIFVATVN